MKQKNLLAAAMCAAVVIAAPNFKQQLHAEGYCEVEPPVEQELGNPLHAIPNAFIQETVKIAGCAAIPKRAFNDDITLYDSGIAVINYSDELQLQAEWAKVKNGLINISLTEASEKVLYGLYSAQGLTACQSKFPTATAEGSYVVEPSILTTASSFKVNGKQMATGKVQMKGLYLNDGKKDKANAPVAANLTVQWTIKGLITTPQVQ